MDADKSLPKTLMDAVTYFADADNALDYFIKVRWPDGVVKCPTCGGTDVNFYANYRRWECKAKHPRRQFTVKIGTVMEDSPLGLDKWAVAFWLEANCKNAVSSYEVHRALGITQKSAWFMMHRIRLAMQDNSAVKLGGDGKARNMHKSRRDARIGKGTGSVGKAIVAGLLERHGPDKCSTVRTTIIPAANRGHLHPFVRKHVEKGTEFNTDAHAGYTAMGLDFAHAFVDHAEKYVEGTVHTNGLENFWSLLKRTIGGTHVAVEPFHLFRYLDAQAFRFNTRKAKDGERFTMAVRGMVGKRLTYKALTGDAPAALPPQVA